MILQVLGIVLIGAAGALLLIGYFPICRMSLDRRADAVGIFGLLFTAGLVAVFREGFEDSALVGCLISAVPAALIVRWGVKGRLQSVNESYMQCIDKEYESKGKMP